jgi:hypothetical protein
MSSRLAIPWRVALQQSPPPFHRPHSACSKTEALATIRQRMVTCPFHNCLNLGVRSTRLSLSILSILQAVPLDPSRSQMLAHNYFYATAIIGPQTFIVKGVIHRHLRVPQPALRHHHSHMRPEDGRRRLKGRFTRKRQTGVSQVLFSCSAAIAYEEHFQNRRAGLPRLSLSIPLDQGTSSRRVWT